MSTSGQNVARKGSRFNILNYRLTSIDKYQLDENDPLLKRLENIVVRLEGLVEIDSVTGPTPGMKYFQRIIKKELESYIDISKSVGLDVKKQALAVKEAFEETYSVLALASQYAQPKKEDLDKILIPLNNSFQKVQEFVPKDRSKMYFHELTTVSDSIIMLAWFNIFDPITFTEEMLVGAQTYSNKVVQNCLERRKKNVDWVRAWLAVLQAICNMVKRYYGGGLRWKPSKGNPYPPIPQVKLLNNPGEKLKEENASKKVKKIFKPPKLATGFDRNDLLSEIANASRKLNLRHVPISSRLN